MTIPAREWRLRPGEIGMKSTPLMATLCALAFCMAAPAIGQTVAPSYLKGGEVTTANGIFVIDKSGNPLGTPTNPLDVALIGGVPISGTVNVVCISGCSGGGGSGTGGAVTITGPVPLPTGAALESGGNLAAILTTLNAQLTTLNSQLTALSTISGAVNNPIAAQTGNGVLIGAVQGTETAGIGTTINKVGIQGCATCVPVPVTGSSAALLGTGNGWTPFLANALSTTVKSVKSSAGQLGMLQCYNPNSAQVYVQVFNAASGSVTLGTTTPALFIAIAPLSTGGYALANPGINFSNAISIAATTTPTGSTAPTTAPDCDAVYN
jgi:hypothetical protein